METIEQLRAIDRQIAEEVMGWEWWTLRKTGVRYLYPPSEGNHDSEAWKESDGTEPIGEALSNPVPAYMADASGRWVDIVRRLESMGDGAQNYSIALSSEYFGEEERQYTCDIWSRGLNGDYLYQAREMSGTGFAEAVCRAALKTVR